MAESAFYKDSSSSETLFNLVFRLCTLELEGGVILHIIHVSGKRTTVSGVDALSKGEMSKGAIQGNSILTYFPFHLAADQRIGALISWVNSRWTGESSLSHLTSDDWFGQAFTEGNF